MCWKYFQVLKGKIITGLRKESEPDPASVHWDPAQLMCVGRIRFCKWKPLTPCELAQFDNNIFFF
jgi:hypothetical protein